MGNHLLLSWLFQGRVAGHQLGWLQKRVGSIHGSPEDQQLLAWMGWTLLKAIFWDTRRLPWADAGPCESRVDGPGVWSSRAQLMFLISFKTFHLIEKHQRPTGF